MRCTSGGAAMVGGFIGSSIGAWGASKTILQKPIRQGLSGLSTLIEKGKRVGAASHNLWKQLHKNIRGGHS